MYPVSPDNDFDGINMNTSSPSSSSFNTFRNSNTRASTVRNVTHMLNIEVGSSQPTSSTMRYNKKITLSNILNSSIVKERFVHSNMRFEILTDSLSKSKEFLSNPDKPIPWELVQRVICPTIDMKHHNLPSCPICLEQPPRLPRMTTCGHVYCWICILQHFGLKSNNGNVNGNNFPNSSPFSSFKFCPICFKIQKNSELKRVEFVSGDGESVIGSKLKMFLIKRSGMDLSITTPGLQEYQQRRFQKFLFIHPETLYELISNEIKELNVILINSTLEEKKFINQANSILNNEIKILNSNLNSLSISTIKNANNSNLDDRKSFNIKSVNIETFNTKNLGIKFINEKNGNQSGNESDNLLSSSCPIDSVSFPSCSFIPSPSFIPSSTSSSFSCPFQVSCFYFHQSQDGQLIFLNPLCIRILKSEFGEYSKFPLDLHGSILEMETVIMTEENRRKFKYISHLPLGCRFSLVEIDLTGIVRSGTLELFKEELNEKRKIRELRLKNDNEPNNALIDDFMIIEKENSSFYSSSSTCSFPNIVDSPLFEYENEYDGIDDYHSLSEFPLLIENCNNNGKEKTRERRSSATLINHHHHQTNMENGTVNSHNNASSFAKIVSSPSLSLSPQSNNISSFLNLDKIRMKNTNERNRKEAKKQEKMNKREIKSRERGESHVKLDE